MLSSMGDMLPRFVLGSTLTYTRSVEGRSAADGWVLKLRLVLRAGAGSIDLTGAADSDDPTAHRITASASTTAAWAAGAYSWHEWVERTGDKHAVGSGSTTLLPDPRTASGFLDLRSPAAVALEAVRAMLHGKASSGVRYYQINGRQLNSYTVPELLQLESKLARDVAREQQVEDINAGRPSARRVLVRMGRA